MAAEAIVSIVLEQLTSIIGREIQQEVRLVVGVDEDVEMLTSNFQAIQAVLVDAEQRQVKDTSVRVWLDKLKSKSYDVDNVLDEWNTAILKLQIEGVKKKVCIVFPSSCFCFKQVTLRRDIALKIKKINKSLDSITKEKEAYNLNRIRSNEEPQPQRLESTSFVDISKIHGRYKEKNTLVSKLLCESSEGQDLSIISLVGMGGIGKTTLAQLAYNDKEVMENFETRIWVCVSDPFEELRVAKTILEGLKGDPSKLIGLQSVLQDINDSIVGKKFFLVLDDLWTDDYNKWEPLYSCLKNGVYGSKILVTTRKETVARMLSSTIVHVSELSKEECWSLFTELAFSGRSQEECKNLEKIGREIVDKCKGLPLAAKIVGSFLRLKKTGEDWQNILNSELWKLEFEKGLFPPLLLSYNDLPSMIKKCFLYCVIFPKDHKIEKDKLIRLWMAQGYLKLEENQEMETIGQEYFDNLSTRSFFQEFEEDEDGNIRSCKMHDIVHDFAQFLTKNEFNTIEIHDNLEPIIKLSVDKACHSNLIFRKKASFPISLYSVKKLRSLLIQNESEYFLTNENILPKLLFDKLMCLRALDMYKLSYNFIEKIPKEIGKLIHLRYLNLSRLCIRELPETLCQLYNLQTLDVSFCENLAKLPQGMRKLVNLRHLVNTGMFWTLKYMPQGIERLEALRTLQLLVVGDGGGEDSTTCTIGCLEHLNHLRGSLCIRWWRNATDVNDARKAQLKKKEGLSRLDLYFKAYGRDQERILNRDDNEEFLEALQPPPNLTHLIIHSYKGSAFPDCMFSLSKLKELEFHCCKNCERLPPLGKLPCLESLFIYDMKSLKRVSEDFLGIDSSSSKVITFPKLRHLKFQDMYEWEEWDDCEITNNNEEENGIAIMPELSFLLISNCPALKALPNYIVQSTSLKEWTISSDCKRLVEAQDLSSTNL